MEMNTHVRGRIIKDPSFRAELLAAPQAVLGMGSDATVRMLEDADDVVHLVIPTKPVVYSDSADAAQRVIARAQGDGEFCRRLSADPRATLSAELGVDLPQDVRIVVVQDTREVVHVVCPTHGPVGVTAVREAAAVGSSASWGCAVTTADSPCTLEGNSFCTATAGCHTVGGGDPDCEVNPDPGPSLPEPGGPSIPEPSLP